MAEKNPENIGVQSGDEAGDKKTAKKSSSSGKKKKQTTPTKPKGKSFEENTIRDSETARERGYNGGVKSGEARRARRDEKFARESVQNLLGRLTKSGNVKENLKELGLDISECTNMDALAGRLFTMAMGGNLEALKLLLLIGGYDSEENRRERESISADARREKELLAKLEALGNKSDDSKLAISLNDEDDNSDVVIYMPQISSEEECQMKETESEAGGDPDGTE